MLRLETTISPENVARSAADGKVRRRLYWDSRLCTDCRDRPISFHARSVRDVDFFSGRLDFKDSFSKTGKASDARPRLRTQSIEL